MVLEVRIVVIFKEEWVGNSQKEAQKGTSEDW